MLNWIVANYGPLLGALAFVVVGAEKIARLTPSDSDNKIVNIIETVFKVIGVKVPDIGADDTPPAA